MSNLLKANLVKEEETRVIDYNEKIAERLELIRRTLLQDNGEEGTGEFVEGIGAQTIELIPQPDPQEILDEARAEAENILAEARAQAEQIRNQAEIEAEQLKTQAQEIGRQEGYEEGAAKAHAELEEWNRQLMQEEQQRQDEYQQKMKEMEPELVDVILKVVSEVTFAAVAEKREIVLHLVERALEQAEGSRQFLIHVSKEDYPVMTEKKDYLLSQIPQSTELEIIKDVTLSQGQCMIETDGGVFDCGFDTQLNGLLADIKALSMQ